MRHQMLRAVEKFDTMLTMGKHASLERYGFETASYGALSKETFPLLSAQRTVSSLTIASAAGPYPLLIELDAQGSPDATNMTAVKVSDRTSRTWAVTWNGAGSRYENADVGLSDFNWWNAANGNDVEITFS